MAKRNRQAPLSDALRDLVLYVSPADIKGAKRGDSNHCAAANALCRQEHFKRAKVFKTKTYVQTKGGDWLRYITPKPLYNEIMIFDRGGKMEGGEFILPAPKGVQKLGAHVKPTGRGGATGKSPRKMHVIEKVRDSAPKGNNLFNRLNDE
jgi:hypothetical protein